MVSMSRHRWTALALVAILTVGFASPALAQEETNKAGGGEQAEPAEIVPGVVVEESAPAETVADWTYRYLVPTCLALALIICVLTVVLYFTRVVRSRYKSVS
ncbi:MAG: hypothetical protein F4Z41_08080 [Acidimicrobiia bacterium]|nr:hypothetical protein [bacterium]MXX46148.1 hypothetical protein [Acidimicrobiia bacterium]MYD40277.1 hypothetical protein [Acidimicrobiia bacterium]MYH06928.1 hypothetical protein [Acidimicrobiia bacterium]